MKSITTGMDLGDKKNVVCVLDKAGNKIEIGTVTNSKSAISSFMDKYPGVTIVIEAGTHSPWLSRLIKSHGSRVLIGNPRKLRVIWENKTNFCSTSLTYRTMAGKKVEGAETDLVIRCMSMGRLHKALPGTAAICAAGAARICGSVVNRALAKNDSRWRDPAFWPPNRGDGSRQ